VVAILWFVVVRSAVVGMSVLVPLEIHLGQRAATCKLRGLRAPPGPTELTVSLADVWAVSSYRQSYKGMHVHRVHLHHRDGRRLLLFGGLNNDDWKRIAGTLAQVLPRHIRRDF
jgi:hypothetical protein